MSDGKEATATDEGWVQSRLDKNKSLPPLHRLQLPKTRTKSALIRWLWLLGYEVRVISRGLNIRYQQVRNIVTTEPKRAAREDLPPLEITLSDVGDFVDMLLDEQLERDFAEARQREEAEGGE